MSDFPKWRTNRYRCSTCGTTWVRESRCNIDSDCPRCGYVNAPLPDTEPTEQGNQYVMPGCEKDKTRGPDQMDLF